MTGLCIVSIPTTIGVFRLAAKQRFSLHLNSRKKDVFEPLQLMQLLKEEIIPSWFEESGILFSIIYPYWPHESILPLFSDNWIEAIAFRRMENEAAKQQEWKALRKVKTLIDSSELLLCSRGNITGNLIGEAMAHIACTENQGELKFSVPKIYATHFFDRNQGFQLVEWIEGKTADSKTLCFPAFQADGALFSIGVVASDFGAHQFIAVEGQKPVLVDLEEFVVSVNGYVSRIAIDCF